MLLIGRNSYRGWGGGPTPIAHISELSPPRNMLLFLNGDPSTELLWIWNEMYGRDVLDGEDVQSFICRCQFPFGQGDGDSEDKRRPTLRSAMWTSLHIFLLIFHGRRKKWTLWHSFQCPRSDINEGRIVCDMYTCHTTNTYQQRWSQTCNNTDCC